MTEIVVVVAAVVVAAAAAVVMSKVPRQWWSSIELVSVLQIFFFLCQWRRGRISYSFGFCQGILKGGSITVPLTFCLTGLESAV